MGIELIPVALLWPELYFGSLYWKIFIDPVIFRCSKINDEENRGKYLLFKKSIYKNETKTS